MFPGAFDHIDWMSAGGSFLLLRIFVFLRLDMKFILSGGLIYIYICVCVCMCVCLRG